MKSGKVTSGGKDVGPNDRTEPAGGHGRQKKTMRESFGCKKLPSDGETMGGGACFRTAETTTSWSDPRWGIDV